MPRSPHTDIIGALFLAGQIFKQQQDSSKKVLVIFSDMRQDTAGLNIESQTVPETKMESLIVPNDLHGVRVYALGVDGSGLSIASWGTLWQFWAKYFLKTGADLRSFSILRVVPNLQAARTAGSELPKYNVEVA